MTIPDAFLSGRLVDENGRPPLFASFTIVTEGDFRGQRGFVRVQGDHRVRPDGSFTSPPLLPGRYYLRFFGMLQHDQIAGSVRADKQRRCFDFIYPNADIVLEAVPFDLQAGETMNSVFDVPEPIWFNIAGYVKRSLAVEDRNRMFILFSRNMGILPDVGGIGFPVKIDDSFEGILLSGSYAASLNEMSDPEPDGYTHAVRQVRSIAFVIERDTLNLEFPL